MPDRNKPRTPSKVPHLTHALEDLVFTAGRVHDENATEADAHVRMATWQSDWWQKIDAWYGADASTRHTLRVQQLFVRLPTEMEAKAATLSEVRFKANSMREALEALISEV